MPTSRLTLNKRWLNKYYLWLVLGAIVIAFTIVLGRGLFVRFEAKGFATAKPNNVISGPLENQFKQPTAVAVGLRGELLIVDAGNQRIIVMEEDGRFSFIFGGPGSGRAELKQPTGIVVAPDGKVYVADRGKEAVLVFNSAGEYLYTIADGQTGKFIPLSLSVDRKGNCYVFDAVAKQIRVYDSQGKRQTTHPAEEIKGLKNITALDLDPEQNRLFGLDADQKRYFQIQGKSVHTQGKDRLVWPRGIVFNRSKQLVLISDAYTDKIVVFNPSGEYLGEFGSPGNGMANFKSPAGLTIDERGKLYVADKENNRVVIYTFQ